jgi:hypothetical protein
VVLILAEVERKGGFGVDDEVKPVKGSIKEAKNPGIMA